MSKIDKQIRILHLSDIHLGTTDQAKNYFAQLSTDLNQNLKVQKLSYLVLSGDIANNSNVEEYDAAYYFVDQLVSRYGLKLDRVITVPGNHDLNWDLSEEAYDFVLKRKLSKSLPEGQYIDAGEAGALIRDEERYQQRFKNFSDRFYKKVYGKPYALEYDKQAILHPYPDDKILFLALNSCWELDHHYKDRASIKSGAISHAVDQILTGNYDDWLKIAVWHHPVTSAESMKNVAFLEQLATLKFQVAMHGHIHQAKDENFQYDTNRGLRIIAAGTFGAPAKEQVTGIPLQYNLLVLNPDNGELTVETRKKEKVDGAWSADARWGDKNNPVPRYVIPLNYGAGEKKNIQTNHHKVFSATLSGISFLKKSDISYLLFGEPITLSQILPSNQNIYKYQYLCMEAAIHFKEQLKECDFEIGKNDSGYSYLFFKKYDFFLQDWEISKKLFGSELGIALLNLKATIPIPNPGQEAVRIVQIIPEQKRWASNKSFTWSVKQNHRLIERSDKVNYRCDLSIQDFPEDGVKLLPGEEYDVSIIASITTYIDETLFPFEQAYIKLLALPELLHYSQKGIDDLRIKIDKNQGKLDELCFNLSVTKIVDVHKDKMESLKSSIFLQENVTTEFIANFSKVEALGRSKVGEYIDYLREQEDKD